MSRQPGSKWLDLPLLGFDVESDGKDVYESRICTATVVKVPASGRPEVANFVIDPGHEIPEEASAVNGLTREWLRANQTHTAEQAMFEISGRLAHWMGQGYPIVGFNVQFDLTMLESENLRWSTPTLQSRLSPKGIGPVVDPNVIDKKLDRYRKGSRKLGATCKLYGVTHAGEHDASADAIATCRLFRKMAQRHPQHFTDTLTLDVLHRSQVAWRQDQMAGLKQFHEKQGKVDGDYDPGFPTYLGLQRYYAGAAVPA